LTELFWTQEAIQDRYAIYDDIEADNPVAALALDELFEEKAGRLLDHPGIGRLGREVGTRDLVAHKNYILVYDASTHLVRVLRFRSCDIGPRLTKNSSWLTT